MNTIYNENANNECVQNDPMPHAKISVFDDIKKCLKKKKDSDFSSFIVIQYCSN